MPIPQYVLERLKAKDPKLTELNLSRQFPDLTAADMVILAEALRGNPYVARLVLCENKIGDEGAAILARVIPRVPSLTELDVSINDISDEGATALFCVTTLKFLDIAANQVTYKAAEQLLKNGTLHYVELGGNLVPDSLITQIKDKLDINEQREAAQLRAEFSEFTESLPPKQLKLALSAARESVQEYFRESTPVESP